MSETAVEVYDCRQAFAEELDVLARADSRVIAVCNDSVGSSNLVEFARQHPERVVNVGIAEQDMVGVAAGLANAGFVPFVCGAAPFLTARSLEQIKVDIAYSEAHVVLCGMSPGMAYGALGPTHHSIEDLSWLRAIADLPIIVPADPAQTRAALRWALRSTCGCYIRVGRHKVPAVSSSEDPPVDRSEELSAGNDVAIIAVGTMVSRSLDAANYLRGIGIHARVINMASIRPFDQTAVLRAAEETGAIVTVEEGVVSGGLGAATAHCVVQHRPVPMRILGVPGVFAPTGATDFLLEHFNLTADGITKVVLELLAVKTQGLQSSGKPTDA